MMNDLQAADIVTACRAAGKPLDYASAAIAAGKSPAQVRAELKPALAPGPRASSPGNKGFVGHVGRNRLARSETPAEAKAARQSSLDSMKKEIAKLPKSACRSSSAAGSEPSPTSSSGPSLSAARIITRSSCVA